MKKYLLAISLVFALLLSACAPAAAPTTIPAPTDKPAAPTEEATQEATEEPTAEMTEEAFEVTVTDGLGDEVTLNAKPMRIVSLTLGTDEILLDLVGPERLIGVTYLAADETTSNIAGRPALAEVANTVEANPEQIIDLEPDLVLVGSFTDQAVIEQLENAGLTVFVVGNFTSIDAMAENVLTVGRLVGEEEKAQELVEAMNDRLAEIDAALEGAEGDPPRVLYLASGGYVPGSGTTVDDIIIHAGGINAAAEAGIVDWQQISEETLIELDPDVVLLSPYVTDDEFVNNPAYASLSAIANGRVYPVSDAHVGGVVSHYIVLGVEDVARILYPELIPAE